MTFPTANNASRAALRVNSEASEDEIARALSETPKGAFALAGLAVGSLLAAWFLMYIFVFLPRGTVG